MTIAGARPLHGAQHGRPRHFITDRIRRALIENHGNVAAKSQLRVNRRLRRKQMRVAIQVRAKEYALIANLAIVVQAEHLKAAGVGQDRPVPRHKPMQPAQLLDQFRTRSQEQMISVGENDLGIQLASQIALQHPFYRRLRTDRHKHWRLNGAVGGVEQTGARARHRTRRENLKLHSPIVCGRLKSEYEPPAAKCAEGWSWKSARTWRR